MTRQYKIGDAGDVFIYITPHHLVIQVWSDGLETYSHSIHPVDDWAGRSRAVKLIKRARTLGVRISRRVI